MRLLTVRPNAFVGRPPSGNKPPQEGLPSVEPKVAPHEPSAMPRDSAAQEPVPRPIEEQLAELAQQIRQLPPILATEQYAKGLHRLLPQAGTAADMRKLLNAIDAEPLLLRSHPRLLLALADHGPVVARHDPQLLVDITERCIAAARGQSEPEVIWNALSRPAETMSLPALQALADCWQHHVQDLPTQAIDAYVHLRVTLNTRLAGQAVQNPAQLPTQAVHSGAGDELASGSTDNEAPMAPAVQPQTVEQAIAQLVAFAADMAPERALMSLAIGLRDLLDNDRVRTPAQWQALKARLSPAVLAAYPPLRLTLASQLLKSPGASAALVRDIATLCLNADPDTHLLLAVWNLFSFAIQSGTLALPTAQSLLHCMSASQPNRPPAAGTQFEIARTSLALQLGQPLH